MRATLSRISASRSGASRSRSACVGELLALFRAARRMQQQRHLGHKAPRRSSPGAVSSNARRLSSAAASASDGLSARDAAISVEMAARSPGCALDARPVGRFDRRDARLQQHADRLALQRMPYGRRNGLHDRITGEVVPKPQLVPAWTSTSARTSSSTGPRSDAGETSSIAAR